MELIISTERLQDMVGKAVHCVTNNRLIPITSLMSIAVKDRKLTLASTDATNYFYVSSPEPVDCEDFEISVLADTFVKLIQKTTSKEIKLSLDNNLLIVKGNGTYKLELPLEQGKTILFPKKFSDIIFTEKSDDFISLSDVRSAILSNKTSLATDMQFPVLTGYYCGQEVITTNKKVVCWRDMALLDKPTVLSVMVMDLLSVCSGEDASVYCDSDVQGQTRSFIFKTDTEVIYAPEFQDAHTFPVESVEKLVEQEFVSKCVVSRKAILDILDRLSLFVTAYDKKSINLTFSDTGIIFSSKKSSGEELVSYESVENFKPFSCQISIEFLQNQLSSQDTDTVELSFGSEIAIKLASENIVRIIALIKESEVANG